MRDFINNHVRGDMIPQEFSNQRGSVLLPRFKLESSMSLKSPLSDGVLGLGDACWAEAYFPELVEPRPAELRISDVVHKVVVECDEMGTEAAAVTAVVIVNECTSVRHIPEPEFEFHANRPFVFVIHSRRMVSVTCSLDLVVPHVFRFHQIHFFGVIHDPTAAPEQ